MSDDIWVESLSNRVRAMNTLYGWAAEDLTVEQVNHHERTGVLPLGFSFLHFMKIQDTSISRQFLGEEGVWDAEGWAQRVGVNIDKQGREETVEEMEQLRVQDWDAYREYQAKVIERTTRALASTDRATLETVVIPRLPGNMRNIYCALVVGDGPVRKLEVVECFVYQHGLRHMGEIEHGRALVGLGGMTS
ncbi:MAG: hypothetical protein M0R73_09725 [Dehalococcoidia bacterium]|nr:hypothetical protein [Dehalococcoidia bacterium]